MRFVVHGSLACFSRPESPDRFTYPIPPPSALRGIISSIYSHPGLYPDIRQITLLNPILFIRRGHTHRGGLPKQTRTGEVHTANDTKKRTTVETLLRDPAWMIDFTWKAVPGTVVQNHRQRRDRTCGMGPKTVGEPQQPNFAKATAIFMRRVERGEFYYTPTLGLSDFIASFHAPTGNESPIQQSRDFGMVLHDFDYRVMPPIPHVFHAVMRHGIIKVPSFYELVLAEAA